MKSSIKAVWMFSGAACLLVALLVMGGGAAEEAEARCKPGERRLPPLPKPIPDPRQKPRPQPPGNPPPETEPPTLPGGTTPRGGPGTGGTPTTPGSRRRRPASSGSNTEWSWATWWTFNRWSFLPSRNEVLRRSFARFVVVTGEDTDMLGAWDRRRDTLARVRAAPALIRLMQSKLSPGDLGLKASAAPALAKISTLPAAEACILAAAEDETLTGEVREASIYALGLLRRTDEARQMSGARLDALRARLLALSENADTPRTMACLAIMSVGMLGDQPRDNPLPAGVFETRALWKRLLKKDEGAEVSIALLTAIGMQPATGAGSTLIEGLQKIVLGKRFAKRKWNSHERSHALCTLVHLGGPTWRPVLARMLADRRIPTPVRRAAFITLGERAATYTADERVDLVRAWDGAIKASKDPLTRGLGLIALGRLLAADLDAAEGKGAKSRVLRTTRAGDLLMRTMASAPQATRGFATLALALALSEADGADDTTRRFRAKAGAILMKGLKRRAGNARSQAPLVVAVGLAGLDEALPILEDLVRDSNEDRQLRAYAAVACGQIGKAGPTTVHALKRAVADYHLGNLRLEAALGLAYLTGDRDSKLLRNDIERRRYTHSHRIGHVAAALGQMGDLKAIVPLASLVLDVKADHGARGAAAVALGLLCDPEAVPSMAVVWRDVNYPARTLAIHRVLSYF